MTDEFYIPYAGRHPAIVDINGHRLVILAREREQLEEYLDLVGGDQVFAVNEESFDSTDALFEGLANEAHAQIVVTPEEIEIPQVLEQLRHALPWSQ
jgi:hypothetical protein